MFTAILYILLCVSFSAEIDYLVVNQQSPIVTSVGESEFLLQDVTILETEVFKVELLELAGNGYMTLSCAKGGSVVDFSTEDSEGHILQEISISGPVDYNECSISVYSVSLFSFTVTPSVSNAHKLADRILQENIPQSSKIKKGETVLYKYFSDDEVEFQITVTSLFGKVDLFVDVEKVPTPEKHTWSKFHFETKSIITVGKEKMYWVAVVGVDDESLFQIEVVKNSHEFPYLSSGWPLLLTLKPQDEITFRYFVANDNEDLEMLFSDYYYYHCPLELTVRRKEYGKDITWKGELFRGTNLFTIRSEKFDDFGSGMYYLDLSVSKDCVDEEIHVFLRTKKDGHWVMMSGLPLKLSTSGESLYLQYQSVDTEQSLGVHSKKEPFCSSGGDLTKVGVNGVSSEVEGESVLMLHNTFDKPAVLSVSGSHDSLTVSSSANSDATYLVDSASVKSSVKKGKYKEFYFEVDKFGGYDLEIFATTGSDISLLASPTPGPTLTDYSWKSTIPFEATNIIVIPSEDKVFQSPKFQGRIYVSVHGYETSEFTIEARYREVIPEIFHNRVLDDSIKLGQMKFYKYKYPYDGKSTMIIRSKEESVCYSALYLSRDNKPTRSRSLFFKNVLENEQFISFDHSAGIWFVAVFGKSDDVCKYEIINNEEYGTLLNRGIYEAFVLEKQCRNFRLPVIENMNRPIYVGVSVLSGDVSSYLKRGDIPTPSEFDSKDTSYLSNNFVISSPKAGDYYVAVCGKLHSTFQVHVSSDAGEISEIHMSVPYTLASKNGARVWAYPPLLKKGKKVPLRVSVVARSSPVVVNIKQGKDRRWNLLVDAFSYKNIEIGTNYDLKEHFEFDYKSSMDFVVMMEDASLPITVPSQEYVMIPKGVSRTNVLNVHSPAYTADLEWRVESCSDNPPSGFSMRKFQNDNRNNLQSVHENHYTSVISGSDYELNKPYYGVLGESFSDEALAVEVLYTKERKPSAKNRRLRYNLFNNEVLLNFDPVDVAKSKTMEYMMYRRGINSELSLTEIKNVNMYSTCAVRELGHMDGKGLLHENSVLFHTTVDSTKLVDGFVALPVDATYGIGELYDPVYPTVLELGVPKHAIVTSDGSVNLVLPKMSVQNEEMKLNIALTQFTGSVSAFVGLKGGVEYNNRNARWTSDEFGIIQVEIDSDELLGSYYVTIRTDEHTSSAAFSVHVFLTNDEIPVTKTESMFMITESDTFFSYEPTNEKEDLRVSVVPIMGTFNLFVGDKQIMSNSGFEVVVHEGGNRGIRIESVGDKLLYYLTLSSPKASVALIEGIPTGVRLQKGEEMLFSFHVLDPSDFAFSLSYLYGDAEFWVSTEIENPSKENHEYHGKESLLFKPAKAATYYFRVVAKRDSFFHATVSFVSIGQSVIPGLPRTVLAQESNNIRFFADSDYYFVSSPSADPFSGHKWDCGARTSHTVGSLEVIQNTKSKSFVNCAADRHTGENYVVEMKKLDVPTILLKGRTSFSNSLKSGGSTTFVLFSDSEVLEFAVHPSSGELKLLLKNENGATIWESSGVKYQFRTTDSDSQKYYLTVKALKDSQYSIAYFDSSMPLLLNPSPYYGMERIYNFLMSEQADMTYDLISFNKTDDSMFTINNDKSMNFGDSIRSTSSSPGDSRAVVVKSADSEEVGVISIGGSYSFLSISEHSKLVKLDKGGVKHFKFSIEADIPQVFMYVSSVTDTEVSVYVNSPTKAKFPGPKDYQFMSVDSFVIDGRVSGEWSVTVSSEADSLFWIGVSSFDTTSAIVGKSETGIARKEKPYFYSMSVYSETDLYLSLVQMRDEMEKNDLIVYTSQKNKFPGIDDYQNRYELAVTQRSMNVEMEDLKKNSMLYVGVHCVLCEDDVKFSFRVSHVNKTSYLKKNEDVHVNSTTLANSPKLSLYSTGYPLQIVVDSCDSTRFGRKDVVLETESFSFAEPKLHNHYHMMFFAGTSMVGAYPYNLTFGVPSSSEYAQSYYVNVDELPEGNNFDMWKSISYSTFNEKGYVIRIPLRTEELFDDQEYYLYTFQSETPLEGKNFHTRCAVRRSFELLRGKIPVRKVKLGQEHFKGKYLEYKTRFHSSRHIAVNVILANKGSNEETILTPLFANTGLTFYQYLTIFVCLGISCCVMVFGVGCLVLALKRRRKREEKETKKVGEEEERNLLEEDESSLGGDDI